MKKILTILCLLIACLAKAQQVNVPYNPSKHVVVNDAVSPAQATPIDGRMMYFDTTNFVWRAFRDTTEVRLVLSGLPNKYRFGNSIIVVDSGGALQSNGTFTNPKNTFWMYRDSTTDGALRKLWLFNDNPLLYTGLAPVHVTGTVISVDTGILATKYFVTSQGFLTNINGLIQAGTNITVTGSGSSISPYVINSTGGSGLTSVGLTMPSAFGVANSPLTSNGTIVVTGLGTTGQYIRGDGSLGTTPPLFNPIAGLGISITGSYPNETFSIDTTQRLDTVFGKYPLYVPPGTPDTLAIYKATAHQQGFLDSLDWITFNNKQNAIQWNDGTNPLRTPGYYTTYIAGTNVTLDTTGSPGTIKINASSSTALQAKQTYVDQTNTPFAGAGVITVIKLDSGLIGTFHSTDTLDIKVQKDTIFNRNLLTTAGNDTSDAFGPGAKAFFNSYANMRNAYTMTWDSLSAGFYMNFLGNKVATSTDSFLIVTAGGQVLKSAVPTPLTVDSAIWKNNGTYTGNRILTQGAFSQTVNGTASTSWTINNSAASFGTAFKGIATGTSSTGVYGQGTVIGVNGKATGSTSTIGVYGQSDQGTGLLGYSSQNAVTTLGLTYAVGLMGVADNTGVPGVMQSQTFNFSTVTTALQLMDIPSGGSSSAGFGSSLDFILSNGSAVLTKTSGIASVFTNVTNGSEASSLEIFNINAGTLQQQETLKSTGQLQLNNYPGSLTTGDTTTHKPVSMDASGNLFRETYWPGGGGGGSSLTRQVVSSGTTVTVTGSNYVVSVDYAATDSALAATLPASPTDLQIVEFEAGGTITSGTEVTNFSVVPNSGQVMIDAFPPTTLIAGQPVVIYRWYNAKTAWVRLH